jgi:hypothetical protein
MFDLSILLPLTPADARLVLPTLLEIDRRTHCAHEVIAAVSDVEADADSLNGALDLAHSIMGGRLKIVRIGQPDQTSSLLVRAVRKASARHVAWWTPDARPTEAALDHALGKLLMTTKRDIVAAMPVSVTGAPSTASERTENDERYVVGAIDGTPVAEIGVVDRVVLDQLGGFDATLAPAQAIADLSLRATASGIGIETMNGACVRRIASCVAKIDSRQLKPTSTTRRAA